MGKQYPTGSIVKYSDGNLYVATHDNPGYNPTISTYFWSLKASNWVMGQQYAAGSIVKFSDGNFYIAKFDNPGYNPTISTYFWSRYAC